MGAIQDPEPYREQVTVTLFGKRIAVLDLSHEISPEIPIYPGHMKVAFWTHLSHEEARLRLGPQSRWRHRLPGQGAGHVGGVVPGELTSPPFRSRSSAILDVQTAYASGRLLPRAS